MEILKRGTPPGEKKHTFTCNSCKSKLRAKESEGTWTPDRNKDYLVFVCPVCSQQNWIDTAK
jgi:hypothetical protein